MRMLMAADPDVVHHIFQRGLILGLVTGFGIGLGVAVVVLSILGVL